MLSCDIKRMNEEADFVRRMAEAMKARGVKQGELAKVAGMTSQSAMSNVLLGKRRLRLDERAAIEDFLEMGANPVRWLPVIGMTAAGSWQEAVVNPQGRRPVALTSFGRRMFAVVVVGDSMDKLLPEGGWAVIDPDQTALFSSRVYLIENEEHDTMVKRYHADPARFEPVSTNPEHKALLVDQTRFRVLGRVVSYGNDAEL